MRIIETEPKTNNMPRKTWINLYKQLGKISNPQLSELKDFLEAPFQMVFDDTEPYQQKSYELFIQALCLKKDGMTTEPSPIESTMTRVQLFLCNSPLWTIGLQPNAIKTILVEYNKVKRFNKPELIIPVINETITDYGTIDHRKLHKIRGGNLQ